MSQVYFYVCSHMAIVVTKIIRPWSVCVVPEMLVCVDVLALAKEASSAS